MATLNLTSPIVDGDTVTAQTLHDLIETATVGGITGADLASGIQLIVSQDSAPSPSEFTYWWDSRAHDHVLRVWAQPFDVWLTVGPDRFELPFRNAAGQLLEPGMLMVAAGASEATIATGATLNILGFCQATTASGAYAPVATCGIGFVRVEMESTDVATSSPLTPLGARAGWLKRASTSASVSTVTNAAVICATLIDPVRANGAHNAADWTGVSLYGFRALLFGPRSSGSL